MIQAAATAKQALRRLHARCTGGSGLAIARAGNPQLARFANQPPTLVVFRNGLRNLASDIDRVLHPRRDDRGLVRVRRQEIEPVRTDRALYRLPQPVHAALADPRVDYDDGYRGRCQPLPADDHRLSSGCGLFDGAVAAAVRCWILLADCRLARQTSAAPPEMRSRTSVPRFCFSRRVLLLPVGPVWRKILAVC